MKVSVLINNFNYAPFLDYCITSVLKQTYPNIEIIFYDDGSTDNSVQVAKKYESKDFKIVANKNYGKYPSFNQGNGIFQAFKQSSGDIICLLDSDDAFAEDKVAIVVAEFKNDNSLVMVQHRMAEIDINNRLTGNIRKKGLVVTAHTMSAIYKTGRADVFFMQTSALSFTRNFLSEILPFDETKYELVWPDVRLTRASIFKGNIKTLLEPLSQYRVHGANDSLKLKDKTFFEKFIRQHNDYFNDYSIKYNGKTFVGKHSKTDKIRLLLFVLFDKMPMTFKILYLKSLLK